MNTSWESTLRSPWTYFGATFLWSWSLCGVLIFTELSSKPALSFVLLILAMMGPGVTGILFTVRTRAKEEVRDYWRRIVDAKRLTPLWLSIGLGLPFLLHVFAGAIDGLAGGAGLRWADSAPAFLQNPGEQLLSLAVITLIPFFEELGWRGYAQDVLERRRSALSASLILGCVWAVWHLPASFIPGTYQAGLGIGTLEFWLHFGGIIVLSVVVSWIYINTNRSILIMVVFHATVNLAGELIRLSEGGEILYTLCWASTAIGIVLAFGKTMKVASVPAPSRRLGRAAVLLLGTFGLQAAAAAGTAQPAEAQELTDRFQVELDALRQEYGFPGATAAYVLQDGSVGRVATGTADLEGEQAMKPGSTMLAASVGKTFVSATALALAQEGRLRLDDPIARWLGDRPWFERLPNHNRITLRQLLNHTSGLPNHVELETFARGFADRWHDVGTPMTPEELIGYVLDQSPLFPPGEGWSYSDTGYLVAGLVIEEAAGRPYYHEVTRRFLVPLELSATMPSNRIDLPRLATGYVSADNPFGLPHRTTGPSGVMVWHPGLEWTGGGLLSNPGDLVRWARALYGGGALPGDYLDSLLESLPLDEAGQVRYGLGVAIREDGRLGTNLGHGGWIPGYCTSLRYYPDHAVGVAFQINTDAGVMDGSPTPIDRIERRLAALVIDAASRMHRDL